MAALLPKELSELTTAPLGVDILIIQEDASQDVKQIKVTTLFTNFQKELDDTQTGAGLEADGTYAQPSGSNYIDLSTSLKDADSLLDAQLKVHSDDLASIGDTDRRTLTDIELAKLTAIDTNSSLVDGANVAIDLSASQTFDLTVTQDFTLDFPTNVVGGESGFITITQDATGSRLMTLASGYVTVGGTGITLSTTADAIDVLEYKAINATTIVISALLDVA